MGTKEQERRHARRAVGRRGRRFEREHRDTRADIGYMVSCWRGKLRSCRGFATLGEAREAAAHHVRDAANAFTDDPQAMVDDGFLAAADWALHVQPEPDQPAGCDLADGTRIHVRLVNGATARCLADLRV
jgi:hypothetical protein